jgi:hypothetical protein
MEHIIKYAFLTLLSAVFALAAFFSCSKEEAEPRQIPGHTQVFSGIAHGTGAERGERYCTQCHGVNLSGGAGKEPSCLSCHGKNWLDDDPESSVAPADHTVINDGFRHHPDLETPMNSCTSCHGSALEGDVSNGLKRPSCFLCHVQKWQ